MVLETSKNAPPRQAHGEQHQVATPTETADFVRDALLSQFGLDRQPMAPSPQASSKSSCLPVSSPQGFLGRSEYLGAELREHEESVVDGNAELPHSFLTEDDIKVLQIRKAFDLPPRSICESLTATFIAKCNPWMPVVSPQTLQNLQNGRMSETPVVLLQALLMAGS